MLANQQKNEYLKSIKTQYTFLLLFLLVNVLTKAQIANTSSVFKTQAPLYFHYYHHTGTYQPIVMTENHFSNKQLPTIPSGSINDLPFFCAMEYKVHKYTNIWIKLRAGDDESYRKMIKPDSK